MKTFNNDPQLDSLSAGREFADYLVMNGWDITELFRGSTTESMHFQKDNRKIEYRCDDQKSMFTSFITVPGLKGYHQQSHVSGPDLEGDMAKFAFLCDALGWVNLKTAVKNFRAEFDSVQKAA